MTTTTLPAPVREKMCEKKQSYPDEATAIHYALKSSVTFGKAMRWYQCPVCRKWHITSKVEAA